MEEVLPDLRDEVSIEPEPGIASAGKALDFNADLVFTRFLIRRHGDGQLLGDAEVEGFEPDCGGDRRHVGKTTLRARFRIDGELRYFGEKSTGAALAMVEKLSIKECEDAYPPAKVEGKGEMEAQVITVRVRQAPTRILRGRGVVDTYKQGTYVNYPFALEGYFTVTIEYTLSARAPFPAQIHDCKASPDCPVSS